MEDQKGREGQKQERQMKIKTDIRKVRDGRVGGGQTKGMMDAGKEGRNEFRTEGWMVQRVEGGCHGMNGLGLLKQ